MNLTDEITLMPDVPEIWVQGKVSGQSSVVSASVNGKEAIPMNRRGDDFGFLLPLEYGKNVIVLYGADGQGNGSSKMFIVERTDKFRAVIESPGFGEFANGRELGVSGTVSAKYAEGTDEELGLAGVSVNGIAAELGEVDGNGNVGFVTVAAVNAGTPCVGSVMPLIMELCWTNVNGELVFPGVAAVTNNCPQVPLGLLEGYEVVEARSEGFRISAQDNPHNPQGMIFIKWLNLPSWVPCAGQYDIYGTKVSGVGEFNATNCSIVGWTEWASTMSFPPGPACLDSPALSNVVWNVIEVISNETVGSAVGWRGMEWAENTWREEVRDCEAGLDAPWTNVEHAVYLRVEGNTGHLKFHAPFYYPPDTTVIFTLEGVSVPATLNITNLAFEIHGAVMVQSTPIAVNSNDVSYLVRFPQTGTNAVYRIDASSFPGFASAPGDSDSGTNSWPYDCALMTFSNSVKSLSFSGFQNEKVKGVTHANFYGEAGHYFDVLEDTGQPYGRPHWTDVNGDGLATAPNENRFPVCFTKGSIPTVDARIVLGKSVKKNGVYVKGEGLGGITFSGTVNIDGSWFWTGNLTGSQPLPDGVNRYQFPIKWSLSFDGGTTWTSAGKTVNRIYATLGQPSVPLYESVLDIACRGAGGVISEAALLNKIWGEFTHPNTSVKRKAVDGHNKVDGGVMRYWADRNNPSLIQSFQAKFGASLQASPPVWPLQLMLNPMGYTIQHAGTNYLANGIGSCQGWSQLLWWTHRVHGITSSMNYSIDTQNQPGLTKAGFVLNPSGTGQGTPQPPYIFVNHEITKIGNLIYDPSYGQNYNSQEAWEAGAIQYFLYNGGAEQRTNTSAPETMLTPLGDGL